MNTICFYSDLWGNLIRPASQEDDFGLILQASGSLDSNYKPDLAGPANEHCK